MVSCLSISLLFPYFLQFNFYFEFLLNFNSIF
jgi:hypothetical protein